MRVRMWVLVLVRGTRALVGMAGAGLARLCVGVAGG
jgi:hypothetical protein